MDVVREGVCVHVPTEREAKEVRVCVREVLEMVGLPGVSKENSPPALAHAETESLAKKERVCVKIDGGQETGRTA